MGSSHAESASIMKCSLIVIFLIIMSEQRPVKPVLIAVLLIVLAGGIAWLGDFRDTNTDTDKNGASGRGPALVASVRVGEQLILMSISRRVLYTYDEDASMKSVCYGKCAERWAPYIVPKGDFSVPSVPGKFGTIIRSDGKAQMTHNEKPLYFFSGDVRPGDRNGDGVDGKWHVVEIPSK